MLIILIEGNCTTTFRYKNSPGLHFLIGLNSVNASVALCVSFAHTAAWAACPLTRGNELANNKLNADQQ